MRGSRVQAVVGELQGEKIDIIPWSPEPASFIVNALQPAEVAKVVLDEGQNVRLASQLTGWDIDIMTEEDESTRRQSEFEASAKAFTEALNVDEMVAQLLASEGFSSLEEVAYVDMLEIASIEGFDDETAEELQARAKEFIEKQETALDDERKALGVADELLEIDGLTMPMLVTLGKDDIKTLEDFAGCAADDLIGWSERKDGETTRFPGTLDEYKISRVDADAMVMQARVKAGWITEEELAAANAEPEAEAEEAVEEETKKTGRIF